MRTRILTLVLLVSAVCTQPAWAHKIRCFAAADGDRISGYAWMAGGVRPKNVPFRVFDPDGEILFEGTTDENGEFSFTPTRSCDHRIVVDAGEGHQAVFVVAADELPAGLAVPERSFDAIQSSSAPEALSAGPTPARPGDEGELERLIARAVSAQIAPLRRELAEFQGRQRLQDVIAGLGYIAGLAGAVFFFLGSKRTGRAAGGPGAE